MFEFNANFFVVVFAFTGALTSYLNARRASVPLVPALNGAASVFAQLFVLSLLWAIALNALRLKWNSFAGIGVGLLVGFAGTVALLAFKSWRHRRRHWR